MKISLSNKERLNLISNLGTMLSAGIPIIEALDSLLEEAKGNLRLLLKQLKDDLNQGKTIADSFAKSPNSFDPVSVSLIRAAEEAGTLEKTLQDLKENIKKDIEFTERVRAAMLYPVLVMGIFALVILMILTFVVPRIAQVFLRLKADLPLPTRILIAISDSLLKFAPFYIMGAILIVIGLVVLYKTKKNVLLNAAFSLPVLSSLARQIDLARFTRNMSLMLSSGIPIVDALDLSQNVVTKKEVLSALDHAKKQVTAGKKLSDGFRERRKVIPSAMVLMTDAGEKSGELEKAMSDLHEYFDDQVSSNLKTLTTLLEPIMLVVVGILVGGIMLSVIAPIYQLIGNIRSQ